MLHKQVNVPFIPHVDGPLDYKYFDRMIPGVRAEGWSCSFGFGTSRSVRRWRIRGITSELERRVLNWTLDILDLNIHAIDINDVFVRKG